VYDFNTNNNNSFITVMPQLGALPWLHIQIQIAMHFGYYAFMFQCYASHQALSKCSVYSKCIYPSSFILVTPVIFLCRCKQYGHLYFPTLWLWHIHYTFFSSWLL